MKTNTIWRTPEAEAWARGFNYGDYVHRMCERMNTIPNSEEFYDAICKVFEEEMERDMLKAHS